MTDGLKKLLNDLQLPAARCELGIYSFDGDCMLEELKLKVEIADLVQKFYGELPALKRALVDGVLPAELVSLLKKERL